MDGGCTLGDSLDDANSNRLGDISRETPMSTTRVVLPECWTVPRHTQAPHRVVSECECSSVT